MSNNKILIVTIDVECDKDIDWHTRHPLSFNAVLDGIPNKLQPIFRKHGIRPTYLLSPEVIVNPECCSVFNRITDCELGSHLHGDYIVPKIKTWNFGETTTNDMQWEYPPELEQEKLAVLTEMFIQQFGYQPFSFRAGRFGIGHHTGKWLDELGYRVDTSVTPHITWTSANGERFPDFKDFPEIPYRVSYDGDIWQPGVSDFLEVPVTIMKSKITDDSKPNQPIWFRPWYSDKKMLCDIVKNIALETSSNEIPRPLVMMFHNVEVIPGASPYPQNDEQVIQYLSDLSEAFDFANQMGYKPCTLSEYQEFFTNTHYPTLDSSSTSENMKSHDTKLRLSSSNVVSILTKYETPSWFEYIINDRQNRWDVCLPGLWIVENISPDKNILETGCGVGFNLLWLAEQGFNKLSGFDLDSKAIKAGKEISQKAHLPVLLWVDDGLSPNELPGISYTVIIALNWTFLIENFSLNSYIKCYLPYLEEGGVFIFDMIDATFNQVPGNQYLSSDLNKPIEERRPSEYKIRMSKEEVRSILSKYGLKIRQIITEEQKIPKNIYIASKRSLSEIYKANTEKTPHHTKPSSTSKLYKVVRYIKQVFTKVI